MTKKAKTFEINGAKIAHYNISALEASFIDCKLNAGSIYDDINTWGAMHLLEHMMFTKSCEFTSSQSLEEFKEEYGITDGGWTSSIEMGFWFKFPSVAIEKAMKLFEQMLFYPVFTEKNLKREKNIIEQEYIDKYSSPYNRFYRANRKQLYGAAHPYTRDAIGLPENIKNLSVNDIKALHEKYITTSNMFIGIAGKSPVEVAKTEFNKSLSTVNKGSMHFDQTPLIQPESNYMWHMENVDQVQIYIQWFLPLGKTISFEDRLKYTMARYMLGGSSRSFLFNRLRDKLGLVYNTSASWSWKDNAAIFDVYASTNMKNAVRVYDEMLAIVMEFIEKPIPTTTFERARRFMDTQTLLSYDSVGAVADSMSNSLSTYGRVIPLNEYIEVASKFTEKDIRDTLAKSISKEAPLYVSVLSKEDPKLYP